MFSLEKDCMSDFAIALAIKLQNFISLELEILEFFMDFPFLFELTGTFETGDFWFLVEPVLELVAFELAILLVGSWVPEEIALAVDFCEDGTDTFRICGAEFLPSTHLLWARFAEFLVSEIGFLLCEFAATAA